MPRIPPGGGGGGGGGGESSPTAVEQAAAASRLRGDVAEAEKHVQLVDAGGNLLGAGPLQVKGGNVALSYDAVERRNVIKLADVILSGAAASRPATPAAPCIYIATDTGAHSSWDGASWRTI